MRKWKVIRKVLAVFLGSGLTYLVLEAICCLFFDLDYTLNVYVRAVLFAALMTFIGVFRWYGHDIKAYLDQRQQKKEG